MIKGSFILEHPMLKRFPAAKLLTSQNLSQRWRFFRNIRV